MTMFKIAMLFCLLAAGAVQARVLKVGPTRALAAPSAAARVVRDGDVVEIDAGRYEGDVTRWRANRLILRGVGGPVVLDAQGKSAGGKAIWVIQGDDTLVENIVFSGARVADQNGAGIRLEGDGLTLRHCVFHDNQMGFLVGARPNSDVTIERSEFFNNSVAIKGARHIGHNIYIGRIRSFTLRFSYIHDAHVGHDVKSRAARTLIAYNRIVDGPLGEASYLVDLPNGGEALLIGNVLHQGARSQNFILVSFGEEGRRHSQNKLTMVNNTLVSDRRTAIFVRNATEQTVWLINNLVAGAGPLSRGPAQQMGNLHPLWPRFVNRETLDFHLRAGSSAIDAGTALADPRLIPSHEADGAPRRIIGAIDVGAYEAGPASSNQ
jgi:hypothetical protein